MAYLGNQPSAGLYKKLDALTFNGVLTSFSLTVGGAAISPGTANNCIISLNGVLQEPGASYNTNSSTITFDIAPATGSTFFGIVLGSVGSVIIPTDGSITTLKLADASVTTVKLADASVTTLKLADSSVTTVKLADASVTAVKLGPTAIADKLGYTPQTPLVSGTNIKTINGSSILGSGNVALTLLRYVAYDDRGTLRALSPTANDPAVIEGLGFFTWESGSTEPDDDESAFATATGVWLMRAPSWDVVDDWQLPELEALNNYDEDNPNKSYTGTALCTITSIASISSTGFTGTVIGASIGDRVITNPPGQLGSTVTDTGCLAYHAWVSSSDTVTIMLTNASAAAATTNTAIRTLWNITVIKT